MVQGEMTLVYNVVCQCPLVLVPHCYQMYVEVYKWLLLCQCPLGPLPHFYGFECGSGKTGAGKRVNALSGCYLISTQQVGFARM